jgi:hypothetical protein
MRQVALTTSKGGITRLRTKGAALNDPLYDLVNGYVTAARTIKSRPGTRRIHALPAGTVGLVNFNGRLHVFSTEDIPGIPTGIELVVLRSPDHTEDDPRTLTAIHFAKPFLGYLYVVAEFDDGNIYHFWLEEAAEWEANTIYENGALVRPTGGPSPVVFRARRSGSPYPVWEPNVQRDVGDIIEPAVYNNFYYEVVAVAGDRPRSGTIEPTWPPEEGALVTESPDNALAPVSTSTGTTSGGTTSGGTSSGSGTPSGSTRDRYNEGRWERILD